MTSLRSFLLLLGWALLSTMPSLQAQNLNDGLVAYYPFNGNAEDESGNGNNGTLEGGAEIIEGVLNLDGTSGWVNVENKVIPFNSDC